MPPPPVPSLPETPPTATPADAPDRADLAALLGSRICHDLISPIGAIGNGLELLMLEPGGKSPELALIAESVASATARLRFFRMAFGDPGQGQRVARAELQAILSDMNAGGRLTADLQGPAEMARSEARLLFLLLLCLETALPYGGHVILDRNGEVWRIAAHSARRRDIGAFWDWLSSDGAPAPATLGPAQVQFALVRADLARSGRRLRVTENGGELRLEV